MRTSRTHSMSVLYLLTATRMHLGPFVETAQKPSGVSCGVVGRGEERARSFESTLRKDSSARVGFESFRPWAPVSSKRFVRNVIRSSLVQDVRYLARQENDAGAS